jgi:hypothetical protein
MYGHTVAIGDVSFVVQPGDRVGFSGLFVSLAALPPVAGTVARALPFTYAVSLMTGVWHAEEWSSPAGDAALVPFRAPRR